MSVKITALLHPFSSELTCLEVEPRPVTELLEQVAPGVDPIFARVLFDDEIVTDFSRIPADGSTVYLKIVPGGDGPFAKEGGKMAGWGAVVTALGVAACFIPVVGGFLGPALIGTGLSMMVGGAVLANTDIPSASDRTAPEQDPSIRGSRNTPRPWGYIPVVFGRHLIYPDPAANPYSVVEGNDQWLVQLFCVGYNDIEIETDSLKIGDTSIVEYSASKSLSAILDCSDSALKMEILMSGEASTLYPKVCRETSINKILKNKLDDDSSGELVRTTADGTTEVNVDIFFYNGLGRYNDDGDVVSADVSVQALIKPESSPDSAYVSMGYFSGASSIISGSELKTKRFQVTVSGLAAGKYTVKILRETADSTDSKVIDDVYVGSIRAYTADRPIRAQRQASLAVIALKSKATDRLNNIIDQFNLIAQSKLPVYSGTGSGSAAWAPALTQNTAAVLKYALQGKISSVPVADADIDWLSLEEFALWCDEHDYTCNAVLSDKMLLSDLLMSITRTSRAEIVKIDSKFSVVQDVEKPVSVQLFTPKNTRNYQQTIYFSDIPDAIDLSFVDEDAGFQPNERTVYNTDTGEAGETEPNTRQSVKQWGVTKQGQAFRIGRYNYACMKLRPRAHTIEVDIEFLLATKGHHIQYAGDIALAGICYGRIKAVVGSPDITGLILDEHADIDPEVSYGIRIRKKNGTIIMVPVTASAGYTNSIAFETPISGTDPKPEVGDLYTFGVRGNECLDLLITAIDPTDGYNATLHCVDYSPDIFAVDDPDYVIPPFDSKVTVNAIVDDGVVNPREWGIFETFYDGETEPARPTGDGSINGWHRSQTALSIWRSMKTASSIGEGLWGPPVRLVGLTGAQGDTGANGQRTAILTLYKWADTLPLDTFPIGDSQYDWFSADWSFSGMLNGWLKLPGNGSSGQSLYAIDCPVTDSYVAQFTEVTWPENPAPYVVGMAGAQGPQGPQGDRGAQGDQGPQGYMGAQGPMGNQGPIGPQGFAGSQGAEGPQGVQGPGYSAVATNSLTIGTGSKTFTVPAGLAYVAGQRARCAYTTTPAIWMEGVITSYSGTTLVVSIDIISGSGTYASWGIGIGGERGAQGAQGPQGYMGSQGPVGSQGSQGSQGATGAQGPMGLGLWTANMSGGVVMLNGTTLRRTSGVAGWTAQCYASEGYKRCSLKFKVESTVVIAMIGLNADPATDASYTSLDFCFYVNGGTARIYENGSNILTAGTYTAETQFAITCNGSTVRYYMDVTLVRSVSCSNVVRYLDSSFNTVNASYGITSIDYRQLIVGTDIESGTILSEAINTTDLWAQDIVVGNKIRSAGASYGSGGFYIGSDGKLSLGSKLLWDGSALTITGTISGSVFISSDGKLRITQYASSSETDGFAAYEGSGSFASPVGGDTVAVMNDDGYTWLTASAFIGLKRYDSANVAWNKAIGMYSNIYGGTLYGRDSNNGAATRDGYLIFGVCPYSSMIDEVSGAILIGNPGVSIMDGTRTYGITVDNTAIWLRGNGSTVPFNIDANVKFWGSEGTRTAGTYVLSVGETGDTYFTTGWVKRLEYKVKKSGVLRLEITITRTSSSGTVYLQTYLNGVALGSSHSVNTAGTVTWTEDITVDAGDLIQGYMRNSTAGASYTGWGKIKIMSAEEGWLNGYGG